MSNFNLDDYIQVNERIEKFYQRYPEGSIQTEILSNEDGKVIVKAYAYRSNEDTKPCTGHAMEVEGSTYINKTSHIENCETSAVGRALAMMGFEIKKSIASREEVENAINNQQKENGTQTSKMAPNLKDDIKGRQVISEAQIKRMFALSKGNTAIILDVCTKYGYKKDKDIKQIDYDKICKEIEARVKEDAEFIAQMQGEKS